MVHSLRIMAENAVAWFNKTAQANCSLRCGPNQVSMRNGFLSRGRRDDFAAAARAHKESNKWGAR